MNKTLFSSSFSFNEFRFSKYKTTDNMHGIMVHYIGYMRKGHARLVSDDGETLIQEGELFYIPYGCRYKSYWYGTPEICFDSYAFAYFPEEDTTAFRHQTVPMTEKAKKALDELASDKRISCRSVALLYTLFGEMLPFLTPTASDARHKTLEKAKRYIETHPKFHMQDLSRHCGISESGLYALFKSELGKTPIAFKNGILAEKAHLLLSTTDIPIEEVGQRAGFCSAAYFRKVIFEVYGKTPRAIRKEKSGDI